MSFAEYLALVFAEPTRQLRSSTQYIVDCFDHYGTEKVKYPWGEVTPLEAVRRTVGRRRGPLVRPGDGPARDLPGAEELRARRPAEQADPVARPERLREVDVHPLPRPRARALLDARRRRALSVLVDLPDPEEHARRHRLRRRHRIDRIDRHVRVPARRHRRRAARRRAPRSPAAPDPARRAREAAREADPRQAVRAERLHPRRHLSPRNRAIYDALLASYQGDYVQVLRHIRVERFEISHRYRQGWVTVEPQLSVDASERQITADRSLSALPPSLQAVSLHEYGARSSVRTAASSSSTTS